MPSAPMPKRAFCESGMPANICELSVSDVPNNDAKMDMTIKASIKYKNRNTGSGSAFPVRSTQARKPLRGVLISVISSLPSASSCWFLALGYLNHRASYNVSAELETVQKSYWWCVRLIVAKALPANQQQIEQCVAHWQVH